MKNRMDIDDALEEVRMSCSTEVYIALKAHIESLEREVEYLNIEIDSMDVPKHHRIREEDWR